MLAAIGHTILLVLLGMLMILFFWLRLPQLCSILVANLPMTTTLYLIQEKHNLFDSPYLPPHLTHLHHRLFCLLASLTSWLIELGHILRSDLSDTDDILRVQTDMCRRANCLLSTIYAANPAVKTLLFRSFCLSLYGSALWRLSSSSLRTLKVTFNNLLRRIWKLPRHCHTSILHCTSSLQSLFNVVIYHSTMLCQKARATGIPLIRDMVIGACLS